MNTVSLIKKKRQGGELSLEELRFLVEGFTKGRITDYQMSAFLMAVCFRGMTPPETAHFVSLMLHSGATADLSRISAVKVDKHSTGGIGDKTTFLLAPLLASCGLVYPTIAGRTLAHTGGTVDKLEAIPGFNCALSLQRFAELNATVGLAFMGQTEEICPADRKLYALRDVTGTVESLPLIVASILSKKLAEGADCLVFDVKTGSGAFMKSLEEAEALAKALVSTAEAAGRRASAIVSDMSEPLGHAVGNAIEVNECVAYLRRGPQDKPPHPRLHELTMELATEMFCLAEEKAGRKRPRPGAVRERLETALSSGEAYSKFLEIVSLQGGDTEAVEDGLPLAPKKVSLLAPAKGFVRSMDGERIGMALVDLGGGRKQASDKVDPGVGFWFEKFVGDAVKKDEPIAQIYARDAKSAEAARRELAACIEVGPTSLKKVDLIRKRI